MIEANAGRRLLAVSRSPWTPLDGARALLGGGALTLLLVLCATSHGWIRVLDDTNLVFHEAGHVVYGFCFGRTVELYGGTLGQLTFPAVCAAVFWWRRHTASFALTAAWFFENFLGIARYMADARAQELPLVGGGEHDWFHIFSRWHVLARDTRIASATRTLGWIGLVGIAGWFAWRATLDLRARRAAP